MIYFVNEVMLAPMINQSSNIDYLLAHTTHKYCVTYLQREAVADSLLSDLACIFEFVFTITEFEYNKY